MTNSRRSILVLFVVIALFTGLGVWFAQREKAAQEEALSPTPYSETVADATVLTVPNESSQDRENVPAIASEPNVATATKPPSPDAPVMVRGRVLDPVGAAVADAAISLEAVDPSDAPVLARSGADGRFAFESPKRDLVLMASTPKLRTLRAQFWRMNAPEEGTIVVAPCIDVTGVVVGEDGQPLEKVKVAVELPADLLTGFPVALDKARTAKNWSVVTQAEGRFEMRRAYRVKGAKLTASLTHYVTSRVDLPRDAQDPVRIVLARDPAAKEKFINGVVLRANGDPAVDATVRLGDLTASCGSHGEFRLSWPEQNTLMEEMNLVAAEKGSQAAVLSNIGRVLDTAPNPEAPLELRLGPPALSIRGVVFDEKGKPLANCTVAVIDPVIFASGATLKTAEDLVTGKPSPYVTGASGEFEVGGLFERDYRLQVVDIDRLGRLETDPIRAGANGVVIAFPADALVPEVRGRVVGRDGTPIADAKLMLMVNTEHIQSSKGAQTQSSSKGLQRTKSLADGSFQLTNVPRKHAHLQVDAPGAVARQILIEELNLSTTVEITVDRYCSVRFEGLPVGDDVHWIAALDANGEKLVIRTVTGNSWTGSSHVQTKGDTVQEYQVNETAVEFVHFYPFDTVVAKRAVLLVPGTATVVKW